MISRQIKWRVVDKLFIVFTSAFDHSNSVLKHFIPTHINCNYPNTIIICIIFLFLFWIFVRLPLKGWFYKIKISLQEKRVIFLWYNWVSYSNVLSALFYSISVVRCSYFDSFLTNNNSLCKTKNNIDTYLYLTLINFNIYLFIWEIKYWCITQYKRLVQYYANKTSCRSATFTKERVRCFQFGQ